jgi:hypothetical protein
VTVHDAELHALYVPHEHDCHAVLFFNPAGETEYIDPPESIPYRAVSPSPGVGELPLERAQMWNPYVTDENARGHRDCIIATADCEHFPDAPQDDGVPTTWRWENPGDDPENLTVSPSIGYYKTDAGEWVYHFFVEDGNVRNV